MAWREDAHFTKLRVGSGSHNLTNNAHGADITVGTEATNVINVAIDLKDASDRSLGVRNSLLAYLSTDATGDTLKSSDANLASAIGTDGILIELSADALFFLVSEADGDIDIDFTKTDTGTFYLNLVLPNGSIVTSGAITFA